MLRFREVGESRRSYQYKRFKASALFSVFLVLIYKMCFQIKVHLVLADLLLRLNRLSGCRLNAEPRLKQVGTKGEKCKKWRNASKITRVECCRLNRLAGNLSAAWRCEDLQVYLCVRCLWFSEAVRPGLCCCPCWPPRRAGLVM